MTNSIVEHQVMLEMLYNKNQTTKRIRQEFTECEEFDFGTYIEECGLPIPFGLDLLVQMALHKRASVETLIGCLQHHAENPQQIADWLLMAAEKDLVDYDPQLKIFIVKFTISIDVQEELDRYQYPLPMVMVPKKVLSNKDTGYLTSVGSIILKNNHHNDDVCLDHINRMNEIPLSINTNVATMVKNKWKNLDCKKSDETFDEYKQRVRAFEKYNKCAKDVIDILRTEGNKFYLTHKYDKRGRIYCQGYLVTYQGASWNKAVIEFADKEIIDDCIYSTNSQVKCDNDKKYNFVV